MRGELRLPVRRVVVGVDGFDDDDEPDDRSMAALRWALQLPGVERVDVSHADFVPAVAAGPVREPGLESEDASRRGRLAAARTPSPGPPTGPACRRTAPRSSPSWRAGTGAFALIEASREADLVVIGTRGRPGFVELILGSTTLEVLAHAHCPVAVVR